MTHNLFTFKCQLSLCLKKKLKIFLFGTDFDIQYKKIIS